MPGDLEEERMSVLHSHLEQWKMQGKKGKGATAQAGGTRTPHTPSEAGQWCQPRITESIRLEKSSEIIECYP